MTAPNITLPAIIPVLTVQTLDGLPELAQCLYDGGIRAVELALRSPCALEAVSLIRNSVPDLMLGAGTVLNPGQLDQAHAAGAQFTLAPGLNSDTVRHAARLNRLHIPGVATPTDIQAAVGLGLRLLKFFPAQPMGGLPALKIMHSPFAHLNVRYIPMGGIAEADIAEYLASPLVAAVGTSAIAPATLIQSKDWTRVRDNARAALAAVPMR